MSNIVLNVRIPLDDEHFLRRECPHCMQEFKIQMSPEDLKSLADKNIESFLTDDDYQETDHEEDIIKYFCPYCGQDAPITHWWTKEQLAYMKVYAKNIMAKIVNEELIKPMSKTFNKTSSGPISISFKGSEMEYEDPWISDEINDMEVVDLQCCDKKIKIVEGWHKDIFCFYCGFEHVR